MANIWVAYSGSFHKKGSLWYLHFFLPQKQQEKTLRKKKRIKWIQSKLQHIPLLLLPGKKKPLYPYCKTNLNFFSKQCAQMSNWNKWVKFLTFSVCNAAIYGSYFFFLPLHPLFKKNFFIFRIIKHGHMPSSELHNNCILVGGEWSPHLRDASLHYHVPFSSQKCLACFTFKPSAPSSFLRVPVLSPGN